MDARYIDRLARTLATDATRRRLLGTIGLLGTLGLDRALAKKHKRKKKCKKKCGPCKTCKKGKCKPKKAGTPCGEGQQCFANGKCEACDVCDSGCAHATVEAAILAAPAGATIQVCPGTYPSDLNIQQALTLVGAGSGKGGTVLRGGQGGSSVVAICPFPDATPVVLRHLTISGNRGGQGLVTLRGEITLEDVHITDNEDEAHDGGGLLHVDGTITLIDSHITENRAANGGGISIRQGTVRLTAGSTVRGNRATTGSAGGILVAGGTLEISPDSSVRDNEPDDCVGTTAC